MEDDEAAGRKSNTRAPSTQGIAQEDLSGEDSDEWKPEDHPQPSDDDEDAMEVETLDKEEQEEEEENEEQDEEDEEEDEEDEDEDEEDEEEEEEGESEDEEGGQRGRRVAQPTQTRRGDPTIIPWAREIGVDPQKMHVMQTSLFRMPEEERALKALNEPPSRRRLLLTSSLSRKHSRDSEGDGLRADSQQVRRYS